MDLTEWMTRNQVIDQTVADALGVTRSYINRVRRGEVHPSLGVGLDLHNYTGGEVELEQLLPRAMRPGFKRPATPSKPRGKPQAQPAPKASRARAKA